MATRQIFSADDEITLHPARKPGYYTVSCAWLENYPAPKGRINRQPMAAWDDWVELARLIVAHEDKESD